MADKIEIVIDGKDQSSGAFKSASGGLGGLLKSAAGFATGMGIFSLASGAVGGFSNAIKDAITASAEQQQVDAQTQAVIKSTGQAAGLSATQISDMADALQDNSTYGNEAIQSGENMLLTFTNIGKDVFPQATQAMLDLSTATGQDMQSSAVQLGKALNDPIAGVTALQRVGVSFTEDQKKQIKTMVESGDVMGAQKLILGELSKEFGGSAQAATKTFTGQMEMAKNQIGDAEKAISIALLPILARLATEVLPIVIQGIQQFSVFLTTQVIPAVQQFAQWFQSNILPTLMQFGQYLLGTVVPAVMQFAQAAGQFIQTQVIPAFNQIAIMVMPMLERIVGFFRDNWKGALAGLAVVLLAVVGSGLCCLGGSRQRRRRWRPSLRCAPVILAVVAVIAIGAALYTCLEQ